VHDAGHFIFCRLARQEQQHVASVRAPGHRCLLQTILVAGEDDHLDRPFHVRPGGHAGTYQTE